MSFTGFVLGEPGPVCGVFGARTQRRGGIPGLQQSQALRCQPKGTAALRSASLTECFK